MIMVSACLPFFPYLPRGILEDELAKDELARALMQLLVAMHQSTTTRVPVALFLLSGASWRMSWPRASMQHGGWQWMTRWQQQASS
jgi:hypothetical protein